MDSPRRKNSHSPSGNFRSHRDNRRSRSPRRQHSSRRSRSFSPRDDRHERRHQVDRRDRGGERFRSRSRSPMSSRKRNMGSNRGGAGPISDNPEPTRCLGVFGMGLYTTETELQHVFAKYGPIEKVQVVKDAKTGRSRGFAFVYFESLEDAKLAKEQCTGLEIDSRRIRVDYSLTQRPHTPTPGIYMGRPTILTDHSTSGRYERSDRSDRGYRRSPSPYYERSYRSNRRGYDRSRSRSYSPRK